MTTQTTEQGPGRIDVWAEHPGTNPTLRAGLIALADYLTDLDAYPDPWDLFAAFVPWVTDRKQVEDWAAELLRQVVIRTAVPSQFNPFELELALDYLTGVR